MPPAALCQPDAATCEFYPFRLQHSALEQLIPTVASQPTACCNDTVTWDIWSSAMPHDVADGPSGTRTSRQLGDVAVRGDAALGNLPNDRQNPAREICIDALH